MEIRKYLLHILVSSFVNLATPWRITYYGVETTVCP